MPQGEGTYGSQVGRPSKKRTSYVNDNGWISKLMPDLDLFPGTEQGLKKSMQHGDPIGRQVSRSILTNNKGLWKTIGKNWTDTPKRIGKLIKQVKESGLPQPIFHPMSLKKIKYMGEMYKKSQEDSIKKSRKRLDQSGKV